MAIYTLGFVTTGAANASAAFELIGTATRRIKVLELAFSLVSATATTVGFGRPAAKGITPSAPVSGQPYDPDAAAATGQVALSWATPPTAPTAFFRRIQLPAAIGATWTWPFHEEYGDEGLPTISGANSLVLWNLAANALLNCYIEWKE